MRHISLKNLLMALVALVATVTTQAEVVSGTCGDNLSWQYNSSTGQLTITGTGAMTDYQNYPQVPWYWYRSEIGSVSLPDGLTNIGSYAFSHCSRLTSITLPASVTSIGSEAFMSLSQLTSINIPEGVTTIGMYAFRDCRSLTSITIPRTVGSIGTYAFYQCSGLNSVSVKNPTPLAIASTVFFRCYNATLCVPAGSKAAYEAAESWKEFREIVEIVSGTCGDNLSWEFNPSTGRLTITGTGAMTDYPINTQVPWYIYRDRIESVSLPDGLTNIGSYAFSRCTGLTSITLPASVTNIGNDALAYSSQLTSIDIPEGVTTIGNMAFFNCTSLASITIPRSVEGISPNAFGGCSSLTSVSVKNPTPISINSNVFTNRHNATLHVPVGSKAAYEAADTWNYFQEIVEGPYGTCGDNLSWEFNSSTGRLTITGTGAMYRYYYGSDVPWYSYRNGITSVSLPEGLTNIGKNAFYECSNLTAINIPEGVTSIDDKAFDYCEKLGSIIIPEGVTSIGEYAFHECHALLSVALPESVTKIYSSAFSGCMSLSSVSIPKNVELIYPSVFYGCQGLIYVDIPEGVTKICKQAFQDCTSLAQVIIPKSVTTIDIDAFRYCSSLTTVIVGRPKPVSIGSNTFSDRANATLYVPVGSRAAYAAANYWKEFREIIEMGDANHDQTVSITDVGLMIDHILGGKPAGFDATAADPNQDGSVTITDVGLVIDAILSQGSAGVKQRRETQQADVTKEPQ